MKKRLEDLIAKLDKKVLLHHAELIKGQKISMSEPFPAGQYWICFELVAEDDSLSLIIARIRLPRHPDAQATVSAMRFVRQRLSTVVVPRVYAYEGPGSQLATDAGAIYLAKLEHVMAQWTTIQTSLATLTSPLIGSISGITKSGEPIIDKLSSAASEGLMSQGPFSEAVEYFTALGEAALYRASCHESSPGQSLSRFRRLSAFVFLDMVQSTTFFQGSHARYPLNHMDLGTQNIIVDDDLNFLAVIDWEFAQTAPWQVNHYPIPFPLLRPDERIKTILDDPQHLAHRHISRQADARELYCRKFRDVEAKLEKEGVRLGNRFAEVMGSAASRIYACFSKLGHSPEQDKGLVYEMDSFPKQIPIIMLYGINKSITSLKRGEVP
ncbi:Aminoglycoside phosphotransferase [Metarhizium rileyi]|uniref:Aminoglycoside phosphotransferase n=1 Tax=Metarhizium rileyi (strain RCEF 4871) TaxID=1649241 RepID=A0A167AE68_METRR|nr:Aminoglycoside phosphotransferase [Metarhizium rileyi RCEF 4871]